MAPDITLILFLLVPLSASAAETVCTAPPPLALHASSDRGTQRPNAAAYPTPDKLLARPEERKSVPGPGTDSPARRQTRYGRPRGWTPERRRPPPAAGSPLPPFSPRRRARSDHVAGRAPLPCPGPLARGKAGADPDYLGVHALARGAVSKMNNSPAIQKAATAASSSS